MTTALPGAVGYKAPLWADPVNFRLWISVSFTFQAGWLTFHCHSVRRLPGQNWWVTDKLLKGMERIIRTIHSLKSGSDTGVNNQHHLFRYRPEVFGTEVRGRGAGLQVIFSCEPPQPQKLTVTVERVPTEAQHQR